MSSPNKLLPIVISFFCSTLYAQNPNEDQSEWTVRLGSGVIADSQIWQDTDTQVAMIPFFDASIGNWHFSGDNPIAYQVSANDWASFYVGLGLRNDGYDGYDFTLNNVTEASIFKGYKTPDTEGVINYGTSFGWMTINASSDISNKSDSTTVEVTAELPLYESATGFSVSVSTSALWMDANYVNYYYGISGNQVDNTVGRSFYDTNKAINYGVSINAMYLLNQHWMLLGELSHSLLADEISESPLVGSDHQDTLALLAIYQF